MIILASSSPRRVELMNKITSDFKSISPEVDEHLITDLNPAERVKKIAFLKASKVYHSYPDDIVIGCDTLVYCQKKFLGKPKNEKEAYKMLQLIQGKSHAVYTGIAILSKGKIKLETTMCNVIVSPLSTYDISEYVKTGEGLDKAGCYAYQGIFKKYILHIDNDPEIIIGFPTSKIRQLLEEK